MRPIVPKAVPPTALIPLIQGELQMGNDAGHEHYRRAGEMLIEAKEQVSYGQWGQWLTKNFDLSSRQAQVYMQWARHSQKRVGDAQAGFGSLSQMTGHTERRREFQQSKQAQDFRRVLRDVARDDFVQGPKVHHRDHRSTPSPVVRQRIDWRASVGALHNALYLNFQALKLLGQYHARLSSVFEETGNEAIGMKKCELREPDQQSQRVGVEKPATASAAYVTRAWIDGNE
jgi:hypothetical protein